MHNLLKESSTGLWFFGKNKQLRKFWMTMTMNFILITVEQRRDVTYVQTCIHNTIGDI